MCSRHCSSYTWRGPGREKKQWPWMALKKISGTAYSVKSASFRRQRSTPDFNYFLLSILYSKLLRLKKKQHMRKWNCTLKSASVLKPGDIRRRRSGLAGRGSTENTHGVLVRSLSRLPARGTGAWSFPPPLPRQVPGWGRSTYDI